MLIEIRGNIQWAIAKDPASGRWIGKCDPLQLTAEGETYGELQEVIVDTIQALLCDLLEDGELARFLADHGWKPVMPLPQSWRPNEEFQFDLPYSVMEQNVTDFEAALHQ